MTIKNHKAILSNITKGDNILIALSGGPDSTYLTYLLFSLKDKLALNLSLCYFNHCLRKEAGKDINFVKELAEKLQLKLYIDNWENPKISQKMARRARYDFFLKIAKEIKADKIATGHNLDDNVETILFHIIRGECPYGIPEQREENGVTIIRPLLTLPKEKIRECLVKNKIPFIIDKTNKKPIYTRNKIRLKLIPVLSQLNPKFKNGLVKLSVIWKRNLSFLEESAKRGISHPAVLAHNLRKQGLSFSRIEEILKKGFPPELKEVKDFYCELPIPGSISIGDIKIEARIIPPHLSFKTSEDIALFDYELLKPPIFIRNIKDGDRFTPYGCCYQKKVARFFITEKIAKEKRRQIPILFDKEGVLSILGIRRSNRAILTEKTKNVLRVSVQSKEGCTDCINTEDTFLPLGQ